MGKHIKMRNVDLAYIAGFLDGDGSVMVQVKRRSDTSKGWRLMFTICFYQDINHSEPLLWIKKIFGIGYVYYRNDRIAELRINGIKQVFKILKQLFPYLKFKKCQVKLIIEILSILNKREIAELSMKEKLKIAENIYRSRQLTYKSGWKKFAKSKEELEKILTS